MSTSAVFFSLALELAEKAKWICKPNPAVGAVIVKRGEILALGYTQAVGGNHAEIEALELLKSSGNHTAATLAGSALYVSLMPCAFTGKTPPCVNAIIKSGIREVHVALFDNDPRMKDSRNTRATAPSEKELRVHGVKIIYDCPLEIAQKLFYLNWDYYKKNHTSLPSFTLKYAMSADGKIALVPVEAKSEAGTEKNHKHGRLSRLQLSNPASITQVHEERAQHEAILIGGRTLVNDRSRLNVRILKPMQKILTQSVTTYPWKTSALVFNKKIITVKPFKNLLTQLQNPTPLVLSRSDLTQHPSPANNIFIVPNQHRLAYQKISRTQQVFFWNEKTAPRTLASAKYLPTQPSFWENFSKQTHLYSIYVEGGAGIQRLLVNTRLFDRVSIYLTPNFLFDGSALSPFTISESISANVSNVGKSNNVTNLWQTHFITLDDNVCMHGFLNRSLAEKIWQDVYPLHNQTTKKKTKKY